MLLAQLVLLPYVDFEKDEFLEYKAEEEKSYWTDEATQAGARFVAAIVGLDKSLREGTEVTVAPDWVEAEAYRLPAEGKLRDKLLQVEVEIESLHQKKEGTQSQLAEETALKNLLFENGTPLENAIHMALRMMGFKVSRYEEGESEFDVVFECAEGRLIGEVEGKDNAAVNIAKLRQLEMNIHEDFERDEVEEMAKGALFGNAFRFLEPENRGDFFTQKCLTAAARSQTALVRSVDLFNVAKYLSEKSNNTFAKKCRTAIIESVGVVEFPPIPASKAKAKEKVSAD